MIELFCLYNNYDNNEPGAAGAVSAVQVGAEVRQNVLQGTQADRQVSKWGM